MLFAVLSSIISGAIASQQQTTLSPRDNHFPLTGFVVAREHNLLSEGSSGKQDLVLKVHRKSRHPGFCHTLRFVDLPVDTSTSPLMGSAEFTIDASQMYNDYYSWTNGKEYISFIPYHSDDDNKAEGNWLVGPKPGVDSGYIFLSTKHSSMVPINLERPGHYWKWLIKGNWSEQSQMRLVCASAPTQTKQSADASDVSSISSTGVNVSVPSHFIVEYFRGNEALHSVVLTNINAALWNLLNQDESSSNMFSQPNPLFSVLHCRTTGKWRLLSDVHVIATVGQPVLLSGGSTDPSRSYAVVLVSDENGPGRFRLTFRNYKFPPSRQQEQQEAALSSDGTATLFGQRSPATIRVSKQSAVAAGEEEWSLLVGSDNVRAVTDFGDHADRTGSGELVLSPLTASLQMGVLRSIKHDIGGIKTGDYVWIWYSGGVVAEKGAVGASSGDDDSVDELLLRCMSRTDSLLVFEYFPTHRQDQMRQSRLSKDTEFVSMQLTSCAMEGHDLRGCSSVAAMLTLSFRNTTIALHGLIPIGRDALGYLHRHLVHKEGTPNGMSSCYMYHAAVSMPQALIYAAEILCVLIGSKPVTLVNDLSTAVVNDLSSAVVNDLSTELSPSLYRYSTRRVRTTSGSSRWCRIWCVPSCHSNSCTDPLSWT